MFPIKGAAHVGVLDAKIILIKFTLEDDCSSVLRSGQAMVVGRCVRFVRWMPDWRRRTPVVPIWIQLPGLPYHLFNFDALSHVCALVGRLMEMDAPTVNKTRPSVSRARIQLDLRKKRVDRIRMEKWSEEGEVFGFWHSCL